MILLKKLTVKIIFPAVLILFCVSCQTVDMEKSLRNTSVSAQRQEDSGELVIPSELLEPRAAPREPQIIVIERPVYVPNEQEETPPAGQAAAVQGQAAVRQSNSQGIILPQEFSHAAIIYDYHPDWIYEIYTRPLRVTSIRLEPGERVVENPFISDSERWSIGAGISFENNVPVQHIYARPSIHNLQTSLIINTDRRVYHLILKSFTEVYMPMVRWRYPVDAVPLPNNFIPALSGGQGSSAIDPSESGAPGLNVDPRFLSFNYRATYSWFRRPAWFPELVFDDGQKTYIFFPLGVLQASLPAVFDNRKDLVNYRVVEHVIVIDRLIEKITIRLENREIVIEKKTERIRR